MKVEAMQEKLYEFEVGDSQFSESLSHHIACSGEQEEQPPLLWSAQRCQGDAKAAFAKGKSSLSLVSSLKFFARSCKGTFQKLLSRFFPLRGYPHSSEKELFSPRHYKCW